MKLALVSSAAAVLFLSGSVVDGFVTTPTTSAANPAFSSSFSCRSTTTTPTPTCLHGFLDDLKGLPSLFQQPDDDAKTAAVEPAYDTVVIDPDFRVAGIFLAAGLALDCIPYLQVSVGPLVTLLGALFLYQTLRIRFVFDAENNLELVTTASLGDASQLQSSGDNVIVGGANKWACDTVVNYDFFPQSWMDAAGVPILIYFKETQTPEASWNEGPGKSANDPAKIAAGQAVAGQVHFFPAVCNAEQMREEFAKRKCGKL